MLGIKTSKMEDQIKYLDEVWVFGYGSLTWNPDFVYEESHVGFIEGFARRFWQSSKWHRGNENTPGRVVTLVKQLQSQVWGIAFKVNKKHINQALGKLNHREVKLGGYEIHQETFHSNTSSSIIPVLVYVATETNELFVGRETTEELAQQIVCAHGRCGPNIEYLFRLVDFMREHAPHAEDEHLYDIDMLVRKLLGLPVDRTISWQEMIKQGGFIVNLTLTISNQRI